MLYSKDDIIIADDQVTNKIDQLKCHKTSAIYCWNDIKKQNFNNVHTIICGNLKSDFTKSSITAIKMKIRGLFRKYCDCLSKNEISN